MLLQTWPTSESFHSWDTIDPTPSLAILSQNSLHLNNKANTLAQWEVELPKCSRSNTLTEAGQADDMNGRPLNWDTDYLPGLDKQI